MTETDSLMAAAKIIDPDPDLWEALGEQDHPKIVMERIIQRRKDALAKARQIAALPCKGGEAEDPEIEETYQVGKRDGYEDAIRDLDLQTGGDGEFVARTNGETVDVDVMRQRIIDRLATPTTEPDTGRRLREALEEVRDLLMERIHGNPARSAAHNARLKVEGLLAALSDTPSGRDSSSREALTHPKVDVGPLPHAITDHSQSQD